MSVRPGDATVSAVISSWNKREDLRENLVALRLQTRAPEEIILVSAGYHARKAAHAANIAAERDRSGVDLPEVQW